MDVGDLVYLHHDRVKTHARQRYLVVSVDGDWCSVRKFVGQQLCVTSYHVKRSECMKVPSYVIDHPRQFDRGEESSEDESEVVRKPLPPPKPPDIPQALSTPAESHRPANIHDDILPQSHHLDEDIAFSNVDAAISCDHVDINSYDVPHNDSCSAGDSVSDKVPRQSSRQRKKPAWHKDYEWDV